MSDTNKPEIDPQNPPEWIQSLEDLLEQIDPEDAKRGVKDFESFLAGEMTWAEVQGLPKAMLFQMAERAYLQFKSGRFKEAEEIFKALCIFDHKTAYYHTALGAIYQKQQQLFDAVAEYTVAIELDPEDVTAYVNRGEVYASMGFQEQPLQDFEEAIKRDPGNRDPWANRARFLKKQLLDEINEI